MTRQRITPMPTAGEGRTNALDTGVWRLATWFLPIAVQVVLAVSAGVTWLLSKGLFVGRDAFGALVLTGALITTALSLLVGGYASRSTASSRRRSFGLSIAGAGSAVLIGAAAYVLLLLPLLETGD